MARHRRGKQKASRRSSTEHVAAAGGSLSPTEARVAAAEPASEADEEATQPVIVVYESRERDSKTCLQIVQSGFGSTAAWTALVDAWRGTSASFALRCARVVVPLGRSVLAALRCAAPRPAPSPALRPVLARP